MPFFCNYFSLTALLTFVTSFFLYLSFWPFCSADLLSKHLSILGAIENWGGLRWRLVSVLIDDRAWS